jgi:hypothetical protein
MINKETEDQHPDILDGYALVGTDRKNSWRTEIRSMLTREMSTGQDISYLTHECRAEHIGASIFTGKLYEFAIVCTTNQNYALRYGAANYGFRQRSQQPVIEPVDLEVEINAPLRKITRLSLEEAIDFARNGNTSRLFMKIEYELGGENYICLTPCRYINFPNISLTDKIYIQPISGYTLFNNGKKLMTSYIATYVSPEFTNIEVISRDQISLLDIKASLGIVGAALQTILYPFKAAFMTDEFHAVTRLSGKVEIFTYK